MNFLSAAAALATRMDLSCSKCGKQFPVNSPAPCAVSVFVAFTKTLRCPACHSKKLNFGQNRTVTEDAAFAQASAGSSCQERLFDWLNNGETGSSSRAIAAHLSGNVGIAGTDKAAHPLDVGDLKRCCHLLRRVPEFADDIADMATLSSVWARLAPRFMELVALLSEETGADLPRINAPRTAALLSELISAPAR